MKLKRIRPTESREHVVAMIDIVFFLLVFFMLVGRMDATAPFEVTPPLSQLGDNLPAGGITISMSEDGAIALDGAEMSLKQLTHQLSQLVVSESKAVRVNADAQVRIRDYASLLAALDPLGFDVVSVIVTPPVQ